jgi:hypothetical protein
VLAFFGEIMQCLCRKWEGDKLRDARNNEQINCEDYKNFKIYFLVPVQWESLHNFWKFIVTTISCTNGFFVYEIVYSTSCVQTWCQWHFDDCRGKTVFFSGGLKTFRVDPSGDAV